MTFTDPQWLTEERQCLTAIKRGERAAFQRLYQVMAPPLYTQILLPHLGDPVAAEEAPADTFARAVERLDGYEGRGGSIWSWLVTNAANRVLDLFVANLLVARGAAHEAAGDPRPAAADYQRALAINEALLTQAVSPQ